MGISSNIKRTSCGVRHDLQTGPGSQAIGCWTFFRAAVVAGFAIAAAASAHALTPVEIVPHKAAYIFDMVSADPAGGIADVTGGMTFEWADACDGWALNQHYLLRISNSDGSQTDINTSNVTWEAKDGLRYRFNIKRGRDGKVVEDVRGDARLKAQGSDGTVEFTKPKPHKLALPAGTKFPTDLMLGQMRAAVNGSRMERDLVFEGSTLEGPQSVTTTILPSRAAQESEILQPPLGPNATWPMYVAYFPMDNQDGQPETEISLDVQANGVVTKFVVDYGTFKLRAKLAKIAALPDINC